jgi:type I restriction enzyme R subunit
MSWLNGGSESLGTLEKARRRQVEAVVTQDYYSDGSGKAARYYQANAINRVVEAIAKGETRLLLVMATGTGKTFTAFQIMWRLWKAKAKKRILFLADRNILVDQARTNDFKPFKKAMTKIKNRKVSKEFEIYLALYQAISGTDDQADGTRGKAEEELSSRPSSARN